MLTPSLRALLRALGLLGLLLLAWLPGYRRQQAQDPFRLGPALAGAWTPGLGTSLLRCATWAMEGAPVGPAVYRRVCRSGWDWDPVAPLEWLRVHGKTQVFLEDRVLFLVRPRFGLLDGCHPVRILADAHARCRGWLGLREQGPDAPLEPQAGTPGPTPVSSRGRFQDPSAALLAQLRRMARAGIRIVVLPMPLGPANQPWDPGLQARRDQWLKRLQEEGSVRVWGCPESFQPGDFSDDAHMSPSGSRRYSAWLLARIAQEPR